MDFVCLEVFFLLSACHTEPFSLESTIYAILERLQSFKEMEIQTLALLPLYILSALSLIEWESLSTALTLTTREGNCSSVRTACLNPGKLL